MLQNIPLPVLLLLISGASVGIAAWLSYNSPVAETPIPAIAPHHREASSLVTEAYDPAVALNNLQERMIQEPEAMVECHMLTHMIGHEAYRTLGQRALDIADPMCGGGYLHGVIEQAFLENGADYLSASVHDTCTDANMESCLHGVGHGLHAVLRNIPDALAACNQINTTHTDCYDGVFMDSFDQEGMTTGATMSLADAADICAAAAPAEQPSCYFYLPRVVPQADHQSIIDLCTSSRVGSGWAACAEGSGVFFMKAVSGFNRQTADAYCSLYRDANMETLCLTGVANYEQYGGLTNTKWH